MARLSVRILLMEIAVERFVVFQYLLILWMRQVTYILRLKTKQTVVPFAEKEALENSNVSEGKCESKAWFSQRCA